MRRVRLMSGALENGDCFSSTNLLKCLQRYTVRHQRSLHDAAYHRLFEGYTIYERIGIIGDGSFPC